MSGLFAIALAVLAFAGFAPAFRAGRLRLVFLTLIAGFGFWYWLPALNLLTVGYIGIDDDDFFITPTVDDACWLVLINQLAALGLLWLTRSAFAGRRASRETPIPGSMLALISCASAMAYLVVRFAAPVELILGQGTARMEMNFLNHSQTAAQSFLALWEIVTLWMALFCLGWHVLQRRTLTSGYLAAIAAAFLLFAGSGTRTVWLQALFVVSVATVLRCKAPGRTASPWIISFIVYSIPLAAMFPMVYSVLEARFNIDASYADAGPTAMLTATFVTNNDMMRELAFAIDTVPPSLDGAADFLLTPFTYMMPTFLGFDKHIPAHLLTFNQLRAGIDLEWDEGNVFPGLVADFWLVFGPWSPVIFAGFLTVFAISVDRLARIVPDARARLAYEIASYSYLFFCFRNITGALALVLIFGVGLLWTLCHSTALDRRRPKQATIAVDLGRGISRRSGELFRVHRSKQ